MIWNEDAFTLNYIIKGERWIIVNGQINSYSWQCSIALLYGGNDSTHRSIIYVELDNARLTITYPFLIMGDFNEVLSITERSGQAKETSSMRNIKE